jgi:hypothetical protein
LVMYLPTYLALVYYRGGQGRKERGSERGQRDILPVCQPPSCIIVLYVVGVGGVVVKM